MSLVVGVSECRPIQAYGKQQRVYHEPQKDTGINAQAKPPSLGTTYSLKVPMWAESVEKSSLRQLPESPVLLCAAIWPPQRD